MPTKYEVYTDGSCSGNGAENAAGGCGFIVVKDDIDIHSKGYNSTATTNQRMELYAVIKGCEYILMSTKDEAKPNITIFSDSAYIINCYNQKWYERWQKNGWMTTQRKPVANKDLWERLIPFFENKTLRFEKVKGHSTNKWNNLVDSLAVGMTMKAKKGEIV